MTGIGVLVDGVGHTRELPVDLDDQGHAQASISVLRDLPMAVKRQLTLDARATHEIPLELLAHFDLLTDPLIDGADRLPDGRHVYGYRFEAGLPFITWRVSQGVTTRPTREQQAAMRQAITIVTERLLRPIVVLYDIVGDCREVMGVARRRT